MIEDKDFHPDSGEEISSLIIGKTVVKCETVYSGTDNFIQLTFSDGSILSGYDWAYDRQLLPAKREKKSILSKRINLWLFRHRVGKLAKQYEKVSQQTERAAFLAKHFGKDWPTLSDVNDD